VSDDGNKRCSAKREQRVVWSAWFVLADTARRASLRALLTSLVQGAPGQPRTLNYNKYDETMKAPQAAVAEPE
jgi:hypothetical protein